jgi:hypothetical protein
LPFAGYRPARRRRRSWLLLEGVPGDRPQLGTRSEHIGQRYARLRREDLRIAARIDEALGNARTVVNV